jgi:GT2 family glycosyltransferase
MRFGNNLQAADITREKIAAILTCHNRSQSTLLCLESLAQASRVAASRADVDVYLVDDGCTDGTSDAVASSFPEVRIVPGTGSLYWCGGMRAAWRAAVSTGGYSAYLWLNDDVELFAGSLTQLLDTQAIVIANTKTKGIVVGATRDDFTGNTSYGEIGPTGICPAGKSPRPITSFNGNIVLVPDSIYRTLGGLCEFYSHGFGDVDYAFRASRRGVPCWLAAGHLGACKHNSVSRWERPELSLWQRLVALHRPTGCPPWELAYLMIRRRNWWFPFSIARLYWRTLFPRAMGSKSGDA